MQLFTKGRHLCVRALGNISIPKIASVLLVVSFVLSASVAYAATGAPTILNYQGRLMDASGNLLGGTGTPYCFKYSLYDNSTVGSGSKLWPAGTPSTMTVSVKNGIFNVGIGDTALGGDTLDYNFQDSDAIYLNVDVTTKTGGICGTFETLSPRQRIYSSGYAINANTVGGFLAAPNATGNQIPVLSSGNLILGGTNPILSASTTNTLTLQGSATGDLQFFSSANKITSAGNLTLSGSITSTGATYTNATTTNATTTNLAVTGTAQIANLTVTGATSTHASGINLTSGCFSIGGTCLAVPSSLLASANSWAQLQIFGSNGFVSQASSTIVGQFTTGQASSTQLTVSGATNLSGVTVTGNTTLANATGTNLTVTGTASTSALVVSGSTTLTAATTTNLAVTSITSGLVSTNATGGLQKALLNGTLTYTSNTIALNLAAANIWTGLQQFGNASTSLLESTLQYAQTIQSTSTTQALVLKSNFSSTAGLTIGSTSTPQVIAIDTINNKVRFGTGTGQPNPVVGVFDTGNATDPTGVNGAEYYSSNFNDFRCFGNGAWRSCGGQAASSTGDVQFKNSDGSFTATDNFSWSILNNGATIKGTAGQVNDLFTVASSTGTAMFDITSAGVLELATTTDPSAPPSGTLDIYAKEIAGRVMPKWIGPSGVDTPFQANIGFNKVSLVSSAGATLTAWGATVVNVDASLTASPLSTASLKQSMRRTTLTSSATAGNFASTRSSSGMVTRGNATGIGGFFYTERFGLTTLQTGNRGFFGLTDNTGTQANVDFLTSTTNNKIGLAFSANTGNWKFIWNTAGTAPKVADLGANFPINTTDSIELIIYSKQNDTVMTWRVTDLSTGAQVSSTTPTTNLPTNTAFLTPYSWMTNNTIAAAVAWDLSAWYMESDN